MSRTERDRIVEEAFSLRGEALDRLLDERCAGNPALRDEIEQLLAIDARGEGDFLDQSGEAEPPQLDPAERVGRYVVRREIGRGGMSRVYEAEDTGIERLVALKILRPEAPADTSHFLREVRLLGRMQHDHIVRLYDFGEHKGAPYLVMELLDGETLAAFIATKEPAAPTRTFEIALQVAAAVQQIHEAGILHQDIKPANVFLDASGRAKLLDFGIAQHGVEAGGATGKLFGTPAYLAPEQLQGAAATKASDLYAYGVLLFELFTQEQPFTGSTLQILALKLALEPLPDAPMRAAGIPDRVRTLIAALASNNPAARPTIDVAIRELHAARAETLASLSPVEQGDAHPGHDTSRGRRALMARQDVLDQVEREASGRLAQSIHTSTPIATVYEWQPHLVDSPWASEFGLTPHSHADSSSGIFDVFIHPAIDGRLLLLGSAGAGKTTALLQLAQALAKRAQSDVDQAMPVLLSLSAWTASRPFDDWLVDQLKRKYGIRSDRGHRWLRGRELTLLLDGLDELPAPRQAPCVDAINRFLRAWRPPHIVVCSRLSEYEHLGTRLQLHGAVRVMPFEDEQIQAYLTQAGCQRAWPSLTADPPSLALARSPLFLHLLTVAEADVSDARWRGLPSVDERRSYLFDVYVRSLLTHPQSARSYTRHQVVQWLARLASILQRHGDTDFLIEELQPDAWLRSPTHRWWYRSTVAIVTTAVVILGLTAATRARGLVAAGPVTAHVQQLMADSLSGGFGRWVGIVLAVAAGLIVAARSRIVPVETIRWSGEDARANLRRWLLKTTAAFLNLAVYLAIAAGLVAAALRIWGPTSDPPVWASMNSPWFKAGIIAGVASGLLAAVVLARFRPGRWLVDGIDARVRSQWQACVIVGICASAIAIGFGGNVAVVYGLGIALITGQTVRTHVSRPYPFAHSIVAAVAATVSMGLITLLAFPLAWGLRTAFAEVMPAFALGGFGTGTAIALVTEVTRRRPPPVVSDTDGLPPVPGTSRDGAWWWVRASVAGMIIGIVPGVIGGLLLISEYAETVRNFARLSVGFGVGQIFLIAHPIMILLALSVAAIPVGLCGALFGVLGGLTGPDVVRRAIPNQGIRQSARNVPVFALIGVLVVGVPYGLINLTLAAGLTGVVPSSGDWLVLGLLPSVWFGLLGALIPAAACIQHWTLRLILWRTGVAPWRYHRFLDHATERKFLQRIGGRYRFVHPLLLDHFALSAVGRRLHAGPADGLVASAGFHQEPPR